MKKGLILFVGVVAVLVMGIAAKNYFVHQNYKQPTSEQVAAAKKAQADAIAAMNEKDRISKQPECHEPITVTIADITLVMPRGQLRTKDGQLFDNMNHRCEIKALTNVVAVNVLRMALTDATDNNFVTTYQRLLPQIEAQRSDGASLLLPSGIEKIRKGHWHIFIVPPSLIPTANNEPVAFDCGDIHNDQLIAPESCTTSYLYSDGLGIGYRYFGPSLTFGDRTGSFPSFGLYEQLKADRYHRNLLDSWTQGDSSLRSE